jgi:hypothetical protein
MVFGRLRNQNSVRSSKAYLQASRVSDEIVNLLDTIRAFCSFNIELDRCEHLPNVFHRNHARCRYKKEVNQSSQAERRFYYLSSASFSAPYVSMFLVAIFAFGYGSQLIREGTLDPEGSVVVLVLLSTFYVAESVGAVCHPFLLRPLHLTFMKLLPWLSQVREAQSVAVDVFDVIERTSSIDPFSEAGMSFLPRIHGKSHACRDQDRVLARRH